MLHSWKRSETGLSAEFRPMRFGNRSFQLYAQVFYGQTQTAIDALIFYELAVEGLGNYRFEDRYLFGDAPLAVFIWHYLYALCVKLGVQTAPWLGILFNSLLVGLSGGVTVHAGLHVFGRDTRRLILLGNLFAACGIFWLFGAIHIRDSFALFLNTLILYGFVRTLTRPRISNVILLCTILIFVTWSMTYIRAIYLPLIPLFCILGLVSWTRCSSSVARPSVVIIGGCLLALVLADMITPYVELASKSAEGGLEAYKIHSSEAGKGLGYNIVVAQSLPIRLLIGSIYMHIFPIPLWANFTTSLGEYYWMKGYQGIYLATIAPLGFAGIYSALKKSIRGGPDAPSFLFLALFTMTTLFAVVATSLETRHHGQFLPAFLILSTLSLHTNPRRRAQIKSCCLIWYAAVVSIHILWMLLKHF